MISSKIKSIDVLRKVTKSSKPDAAAKKWQNLSHFQLRQSASLFVPMFLRSGKITLLKISNTLHSQCTAALEATFNRSRCRSLFRPRVGIRLMIYAFGVVIGQIWKILNNIWINISRSLSKLNEKTKTKEAFDISSLCVSKQSLHPFVIAQSPPKLNLRPESQTQKASWVFAQTLESVKKSQARPSRGGQWPFVWQSETIWLWETSVCLLRASTIAIISGHCPADRPTMTILMQPRYGILHFSPWLSPSNMCLGSREGKV